MNLLNRIIFIAVFCLAISAYSDNTCESSFTVDLDNLAQLKSWPDIKGCKITKLWIHAQSTPRHNNLPDFSMLEKLRGSIAQTPRIALDIPHVFTNDYGHNMQIITAVLKGLNVASGEVFGLAGDRSAASNYPGTQLKVMSLLTFLPIFWSSYRQGFISPYHALNSVLAMGFYGILRLYAHDYSSGDPISTAVMRSTNSMVSHLTCSVPTLLRYFRHTGVDGYLYYQFLGCHTWSLLKPNPPVFGYVYCIGGAPYSIQEIYSDDFTKIRFHNSRLSDICSQELVRAMN